MRIDRPYETRGPAPEGVLLLDRNEGPRIESATLDEALAAFEADALRQYPDASDLESRLAARLGVHPSWVLVTAGADDAIDRCCRFTLLGGRRLVYPTPTFEMLERYALLSGGELAGVPWPNGSALPAEALLAGASGAGLIAIVTPNNPTGAAATRADVRTVVAGAEPVPVLLDHAYVEYADDDLSDLVREFANLIVVRTLSKAWGLAGCRVGFAVARPEVVRRLRAAGAPYPVAALSLTLAARRLEAHQADTRAHVVRVRQERTRLTDRLATLGVPVDFSRANFVLLRAGARAAFLRDAMLTAGVLLRDFGRRPGLEGALRISLPGDGEAFARLQSALDLVLDPAAILFDLDGVLADVRESYRATIIETAATFGVRVTPDDIAALKRAGNANNDWLVTQRLVAAHGAAAELDEVRARFQAIYVGTKGSDGRRVNERLLIPAGRLRALAARRRIAVVTGRPRVEAEWFLRMTGIDRYVDAVVAMEDAPLKPNPEPVRLALDRLGVTGGWMVGDTPDDLRAARATGVLPIGVVAPGEEATPTAAALRDAGAAWVAESADQLLEVLP